MSQGSGDLEQGDARGGVKVIGIRMGVANATRRSRSVQLNQKKAREGRRDLSLDSRRSSLALSHRLHSIICPVGVHLLLASDCWLKQQAA